MSFDDKLYDHGFPVALQPETYSENRLAHWLDFSSQVQQHIVQYTLPQYSNPAGNEQVDSFSVEDCMKHIERYFNRRHANVRGNTERLRDLIKIVHYAQMAYDKLKAELEMDDVYQEKPDGNQ